MSSSQVRQETIKKWNEWKISELNDEQRQAVNDRTSRNLCVVAGAGSGKTRVLTYRFLDLIINDDIKPREIACLTYTTAAADEMKDRIIRKLVDLSEFELLREIESAYISTIHAFALRLVSENSLITGFNSSHIDLSAVEKSLLMHERQEVLNEIISAEFSDEQNEQLNTYGFNLVSHCVFKLIEVLRDNGLGVEHLEQLQDLSTEEILSLATSNGLNTDFKTKAGKEVDFVQNIRKPLLNLAVREFQELKEIKQQMRRIEFVDYLENLSILLKSDQSPVKTQFKEVLVDEFQDTNSFQYQLVQGICGDSGRMFAVGDAKQSIYRFQQAEIEVIANFARDTQTKLLELKTNYRSHQNLIEFCNALFKPAMMVTKSEIDFDKIDTPLEPGISESDGNIAPRVEMLFLNRESAEYEDDTKKKRIDFDYESKELKADFVARRIQNLVQNTDSEFPERFAYKDIAILVRKKATALKYREALGRLGIPALIFGGMNLLRQPIVLDIFYVMKFLASHTDDINFAAVLKTPFVGVSDDVLYWLSQKRTEFQRATRQEQNDDKSRMSLYETAEKLHKAKMLEASKLLPEEVFGHADNLEIINFNNYLSLLDEFMTLKEELQADIAELSVLQTLDAVTDRLDLTHKIGSYSDDRTAEANFYAFRDFVKELEQRNNHSFTEFVNYLQTLIEKGIDVDEAAPASGFLDSERDAVKIMTIHKAKGLEFPAVFVVETESDVSRDFEYDMDGNSVGASKLFVDKDFGLCGGYFRINRKGEPVVDNPIAYHKDLVDKSKRQNLLENFRMFYVAMTRAERFLFVAGSCKFEDSSKECLEVAENFQSDALEIINYKVLNELMKYGNSNKNFCHFLRRLFMFVDSPYFEEQRDLICEQDYVDVNFRNQKIRRWYQIRPSEITESETDFNEDPDLTSKLKKAYDSSEKTYESESHQHILGVSKLAHLLHCPKMYEFAINQPTEVTNFGEETAEYPADNDIHEDIDSRELGIIFHKVFEHADYSSLSNLQRSVRQKLHKFAGLSETRKELEFLTENMLKSTIFWSEICNSKKIYNELPLFLTTPELVFRGFVDLLAESDSRIVILDFKTDKNFDADVLKFRYHNQLKLYCYVLRERMKKIEQEKNIMFATVTPRSSEPPVLMEYSENMHNELQNQLSSIPKTLNAQKFTANVSKYCTYCYFAGICKDYKQKKTKTKRKTLFE